MEETKNISTTIDFQNKLTNLGDVFVNDAFGCCHRGHSSIIGINTSEKYLGFLVEKELKYLKNVFDLCPLVERVPSLLKTSGLYYCQWRNVSLKFNE